MAQSQGQLRELTAQAIDEIAILAPQDRELAALARYVAERDS